MPACPQRNPFNQVEPGIFGPVPSPKQSRRIFAAARPAGAHLNKAGRDNTAARPSANSSGTTKRQRSPVTRSLAYLGAIVLTVFVTITGVSAAQLDFLQARFRGQFERPGA